MKTTIDIPDNLYAAAKGIAIARGISFRTFFLEVLEDAVRGGDDRPWMDSFGTMAAEPEAVYEVDRLVAEDLSSVNPEEWK
ncbi:MAG: hypothetical protein EA427_16065 [Spirochaetaceae bacterium]|nr:MAG: hypothetical protein EA427_16065 [Spirochaetaceae bacterium]